MVKKDKVTLTEGQIFVPVKVAEIMEKAKRGEELTQEEKDIIMTIKADEEEIAEENGPPEPPVLPDPKPPEEPKPPDVISDTKEDLATTKEGVKKIRADKTVSLVTSLLRKFLTKKPAVPTPVAPVGSVAVGSQSEKLQPIVTASAGDEFKEITVERRTKGGKEFVIIKKNRGVGRISLPHIIVAGAVILLGFSWWVAVSPSVRKTDADGNPLPDANGQCPPGMSNTGTVCRPTLPGGGVGPVPIPEEQKTLEFAIERAIACKRNTPPNDGLGFCMTRAELELLAASPNQFQMEAQLELAATPTPPGQLPPATDPIPPGTPPLPPQTELPPIGTTEDQQILIQMAEALEAQGIPLASGMDCATTRRLALFPNRFQAEAIEVVNRWCGGTPTTPPIPPGGSGL